MDIYNKIIKKINDHEAHLGCKPNSIYLGHEDFNELKNVATTYMGYDPWVKSSGNEFYGVEIVKVDKKQHLAISYTRTTD